MTSLQLKYLLAAGVGVAVIGVGTWAYISKPATPALDLNKSVADSKPPRAFELSSDKSTTAKPSGTNTSAKPNAGSTTPPTATPVTPPRTEVAPPARRTITEPPANPMPPRTGDSSGPPGSITPPPEATRSTLDSPTTITPPTANSDVKLPPIGGNSTPPTTGGSTETPAKPADTIRNPTDKPLVPEARPASEPDKPAGTDGPRVTFPPPSSAGETLKPSGGSSTPPDKATPAGRRNIRDTEIERPGGGATPAPKPTPTRDNATPPAGGATETYTIASGDTLAKIAATRYGDEKLWTEIKKANPGLDENRLKVGTKVTLPARTVSGTAKPDKANGTKPSTDVKETASSAAPMRPEKPAATSGDSHTVAQGETLVKIARTHLKDDKRWREIYELNRDKLKNPNAVEPGMVLKLPAVAKADPPKRESTSRRSGTR